MHNKDKLTHLTIETTVALIFFPVQLPKHINLYYEIDTLKTVLQLLARFNLFLTTLARGYSCIDE